MILGNSLGTRTFKNPKFVSKGLNLDTCLNENNFHPNDTT